MGCFWLRRGKKREWKVVMPMMPAIIEIDPGFSPPSDK